MSTGLAALIDYWTTVIVGEWKFDIEILNGAEYDAQELGSLTPAGNPKPRVIFTANGINGNVKDRYEGGSPSPGRKVTHEARQVLTRRQGVEVRIWGFSLDPVATKAMHQEETDPIINAVVAAIATSLGEATETWKADDGGYDNDAKDISFGALYVFTFHLAIPIIFPAVQVVRPGPNVITGALLQQAGAGG